MLGIQLNNCGKKFTNHWLFRKLDFEFSAGNRYALLGKNGSGKSTLLQIISGYIAATEGEIFYLNNNEKIPAEHWHKYISFASPFMELPDEFTLHELLSFHAKFKQNILPMDDIPAKIQLAEAGNRYLKNFSSGMMQRVKLGLAFLFQSDVILLDEPASHLDAEGIKWYNAMLQEYTSNKLLIIASNDEAEYSTCNHFLKL